MSSKLPAICCGTCRWLDVDETRADGTRWARLTRLYPCLAPLPRDVPACFGAVDERRRRRMMPREGARCGAWQAREPVDE